MAAHPTPAPLHSLETYPTPIERRATISTCLAHPHVSLSLGMCEFVKASVVGADFGVLAETSAGRDGEGAVRELSFFAPSQGKRAGKRY